jgi:hypothetical protein
MLSNCWLLLCVALASGCGRPHVQEGQLFVATRSGQNVTLGAIEILAFDEATINSFKEQKSLEIDRQRDKLQQDTTMAQADLQKFEEPYRKAMTAYRDAETRYNNQAEVIRRESEKAKELDGKMHEATARIDDYVSRLSDADQRIADVLKDAQARAAIAQEEATRKEIYSRTNFDPSIIQANNDKRDFGEALTVWLSKSNEASKLVADQRLVLATENEKFEKIGTALENRKSAAKRAEDPFSEAQDKSEAAGKALANFVTTSVLFSNLPRPTVRTVTDAEGKFRFEQPSGGRFAVFAHAQRNVGEANEDYIWLVWSSGDGKLLLNNANMFGSKSTDQVVQNNF